MIETFHWSFLAGLIEADGCISLIWGTNGYPHSRVQFANQSTALHGWIISKFGGKTNWNSNKSKCYTTHWSDAPTLKIILEGMIPYLISKREEAELLLEYCNNSQGQGRKNLTSQERLDFLVFRIHELKEVRP